MDQIKLGIKPDIQGHTDGILSISLSYNGEHIASSSIDKTIKIWSSKTGDLIQELLGHKNSIGCISFSPNGCQLASGSDDTLIIIWNWKEGK